MGTSGNDHRQSIQILENELETYGDLYASEVKGTSAPFSSDAKQNTSQEESAAKMDAMGPELTREEESTSLGQDGTTGLAATLFACETLDQLSALCESVPALKTDLEGTRLVFGIGNPNADLMLIGEAPGEQEDIEGEPFVGRAGKLLDDILKAIQLHRSEIYIANILKHRPPGNRNPTPEERERSLPYLLRQIELIQPKLILCLGKISAGTLLKSDAPLSDLRSRFFPFMGAEMMVTYHPAALLRNPNWKRPVWEDVQKLMERYRELDCQPPK